MNSLNNQFIMVTGSSRGIGFEIVKHVSNLGAKVALVYSSNQKIAEENFEKLEGKGHLLLQMNVNFSESVKKGFDKFISHFGSISALINNAGITKDGLLLRMRDEDFDSVLKTNLYGSFYCAREVCKYMMKARKGNIINISSVVAKMGNAGQSNYVASKAALEGLTRSMARELASRNIRVNAIAPGFIQTDMTKNMSEKQREAILNNIPLGRMGESKDVAQTVVFLLQTDYITGQVIALNGGLAM